MSINIKFHNKYLWVLGMSRPLPLKFNTILVLQIKPNSQLFIIGIQMDMLPTFYPPSPKWPPQVKSASIALLPE